MERREIIRLLSLTDRDEMQALFARAAAAKTAAIGHKVHLRGLIELSNKCTKDCYYCGIRSSNNAVERYELSDDEVLQAVDFAWRHRYGSVVLQSGEQSSPRFAQRIAVLVEKIKAHTHGEAGITLSCGEQSPEVYRRWQAAGAHRYLLRIESSSPALYRKIHPNNARHSYDKRLAALHHLQAAGYQTGTGVMIGLPFQTVDDLADDLLFFRQLDIDMVGMGPYLEHRETPLYAARHTLLPPEERLWLSLRMVAVLRLLLPDINIAATTALQVLHPLGRELAVQAGANIIMPNMTVGEVRKNYQIYENKPGIHDDAAISRSKLAANLQQAGIEIGYGQWGDSAHFRRRASPHQHPTGHFFWLRDAHQL